MAVCSGILNNIAGETGKGISCPRSLVAVGGSGGQCPNVSWAKI